MLLLALGVIAILFFLEDIRQTRRMAVVDEYKYRFFALRDELRELAADGRVDTSNWLFDYLDSTITKIIPILHRFSLWRILGLAIEHGHDARFGRHLKHLHSELNKPANAEFKRLHAAYVGLFIDCFCNQNRVTTHAVASIARATTGMLAARKRIVGYIETGIETPEASTLQEYCPQ